MNESNKTGRDPLDEALALLPEDVAPERDLWPQIRAEIEQTPIAAAVRPVQSNWFRLAAAVLLVLATSFVTYYVTRQSLQPPVAQNTPEAAPAAQLTGQPASYTFGRERLGAGYMNARAESDGEAVEDAQAVPVESQREYDAGEVMDVERALATLPPGSRHVVVLQTVYGYSHEEVAEMLGIAVGTCKAQLHRGRRLLRERMGLPETADE